jgi:hypothetical protein
MKTKLLPLLLFTFATNAFAALDTPTEDFIDNNDGTVTHKKTGLTWQRCAVGQMWTGSICSGISSVFSWNQAIALANGEWRVPRIDELYSITEHSSSSSSFVNKSIFPNTGGAFWSSSDFLWNFTDISSGDAWFVSFDDGRDDFDAKDNGWAAVRLVKGGNPILQSKKYTPTSEFSVDYTKGTAIHNKTNLMWQICAVGQYWTGSTCSGSPSKMNFSSAISQNSTIGGYDNWRLPTINELKTIVEYNSPSLNINSDIFSSATPDFFWSSSLDKSYEFAWGVEFSYGTDNYNGVNSNAGVRLVRENIATVSVILTTIDLSTTISTPSPSIQQNANNIYTATTTNNGTGTANNVILKFYMPPRWTNYVSMPSDCAFNGTVTVCSLGSLNAGASVSRSITVNFQKRGATSVGAWAGSDETDTNKANNMSRMITTIMK